MRQIIFRLSIIIIINPYQSSEPITLHRYPVAIRSEKFPRPETGALYWTKKYSLSNWTPSNTGRPQCRPDQFNNPDPRHINEAPPLMHWGRGLGWR